MVEFLKNMTEWMLRKEEDLAKKCAIPLEEIDRQIEKVEEKRKKLEAECRENIAELEKIVTKLKWIRSEELACRRQQESGSENEKAEEA